MRQREAGVTGVSDHRAAEDAWDAIARRSGLGRAELELVRAVPVFGGLAPPALAPLLEGAVAKPFARHAVLFLPGEPATGFFVVLEGWVRLYRQTPQGQEITIAVFGRGDSFAEAVVLQTMPFPVSAQAVADSRILVIPAERFMRQLRASTDLCFKVMAAMARRLQDLVFQLENVSSRPTVQRLALFILRLCDREHGHLPHPAAARQEPDRRPPWHAARNALARPRQAARRRRRQRRPRPPGPRCLRGSAPSPCATRQGRAARATALAHER